MPHRTPASAASLRAWEPPAQPVATRTPARRPYESRRESRRATPLQHTRQPCQAGCWWWAAPGTSGGGSCGRAWRKGTRRWSCCGRRSAWTSTSSRCCSPSRPPSLSAPMTSSASPNPSPVPVPVPTPITTANGTTSSPKDQSPPPLLQQQQQGAARRRQRRRMGEAPRLRRCVRRGLQGTSRQRSSHSERWDLI
jgi:hypothetical protein